MKGRGQNGMRLANLPRVPTAGPTRRLSPKDERMSMLRLATPVAVLLTAGAWASAGGPPAPDRPVEAVVDQLIDERLRDDGVTPAPTADDPTLLRRLSLDLAGRIPTVAELDEFTFSADPDKTTKLVDRLITSPGFVRHQAAELDRLLMSGYRASLRDYLTRAVAENRSWDQVFRDVLLPDDADPTKKGAGEFLRQRIRDLDKLTAEVSGIFFGVNVSCAQCHDHPLVPDWKQDHFFGMKSFFARTFDNGGFLGEREVGVVKFLTTKGVSRDARLMFLTGAAVDTATVREPTADERKREKEHFDGFKNRKASPPPPSFSARAQLVDLALRPDQRGFFARAAVNRVWHRLFGRGLVTPLDQMHAENPPSHPELLDWLATDLAEHGYDLRRLIRGLVLSRAYARSSRWEGVEPPNPALFAVARPRPLTPLQLATSLRVATTDSATLAASRDTAEFEKKIEALETSARGFAASLDTSGDDPQIGVSESLLFSNGERFQKEFLADGGDRLLGRLAKIADRGELVETTVRSVLSRPATAEEKQLLGEYLARREDRKAEACRQVVWALLTGAEFRFNH
jgi:Protein of unknown function (DUF1549)/Protein of unknown function (DUF1553)